LAKLQQEFQQIQIEHQSSLAGMEAQIQSIIDLHKDDPNIDHFVTEAPGLNSHAHTPKIIVMPKNRAVELSLRNK